MIYRAVFFVGALVLWSISVLVALPAMIVLARRRKIANVNLSLCHRSLNRFARTFFLIRVFVNAIYGIFENFFAWFLPARVLRQIIVDQTDEAVNEAIGKTQGCLLICPHYSHLELTAPALSFITDRLVMSYRPHENDRLELFISKRRLKFGALKNARDIRGLVKTLRVEGHLWFAPDQDMGEQGSVFANSFGVPACTVTTPSRLAKLTRCQVFFVTFSRRFLLYRLEVVSFPLEYPTDNEVDNARILNCFIEQALQNDVSQYMWLHRRFKTQPYTPRYSLYSSLG